MAESAGREVGSQSVGSVMVDVGGGGRESLAISGFLSLFIDIRMNREKGELNM